MKWIERLNIKFVADTALPAMSVAAIAVGASVIAMSTKEFADDRSFELLFPMHSYRQIAELQDQLRQHENDIMQLRLQTDQNKGTAQETNPDLVALSARIATVEARQKVLERTILATPAKALELPMLRRDIDSYRDTHQAVVEDLRGDIERVYDLSKWLFGGLAVSMITLLLSIFLKRGVSGGPA